MEIQSSKKLFRGRGNLFDWESDNGQIFRNLITEVLIALNDPAAIKQIDSIDFTAFNETLRTLF